jgi:hypothetical protein
MSENTTIADDTLEGAAAIAAFLGKSQRQTEYLLETRRLPAFKLGGKWHMRRSTYCVFVKSLEQKATASIRVA